MRRAAIVASVTALAIPVVVYLIPESKYYTLGLIKGEAFTKGMPVGYWEHSLVSSADEEQRIVAATSLLETSDKHQANSQLLLKSLADPSPRVRAIMAECVQSADADPALLKQLVSLLQDSDGSVRAQTANSLGKLTLKDPGVIASLAKQAESDPHVQAKVAAIFALGMYNEVVLEYVPQLVRSLREGDSQYGSPHEAAAFALARVCKTKPELLTKELSINEPRVRSGLLKALANIGPEAKSALETIKSLTKAEEPMTRIEAIQAGWKIDRQTEGVIPVLTDYLVFTHKDAKTQSSVRLQAIFLLGEIGAASEAAVPKLIEILKNDPGVFPRKYSAMALGKIGKSPKIIEALELAGKTDKDPDVCWAANEALKIVRP